MAVAKSYENFTLCGEPYSVNNKLWVRVVGHCPRCGGSGSYSYNEMDGSRCYGCNGTGKIYKEVRWYTDAERERLDKNAAAAADKRRVEAIERANYKAGSSYNGFGTEDGFITVVLGETYSIKDELKAAGAHFKAFGWYFPNDVEVPSGYSTMRLTWDECSNAGRIKTELEIKDIIAAATRIPSLSTPQGTLGEKLTFNAKVMRNITLEGYYGVSHMHIFEDERGNVYVWTTAAKDLEEGHSYSVTGTVKEHSEYNAVPQTILTRCKVKEI